MNTMKQKILLLILLLSSFLAAHSQENIIELRLTTQSGYGPFNMALRGISSIREDENDPWKNTYLKVPQLPKDLTELKYGNIETNRYQETYQDYISGNITKSWYEELQKSWNWTPDSLTLSKTPIRTKIAFAYGKDSDGNLKIVVDANNNLDLSDDKPVSLLEMNEDNSNKDSLAQIHTIDVTVETYVEGKIRSIKTPLFIMYNKEYNMFMCNFPQYATTEYKGKKIAICSSDFTDLSYSTIGLAIIKDDMKKGEKVERNHVYRKNEYIEIGDGNYKVVEVNTFKNKLILERTDLPKSQLISSQVGYRPFPFEKESFQQKTTIALEKLKGKYVLLDFWAVWCGACLAEIPNLKKLYANVDKSKFEMIGIVGDSPAESLKELIDKHGITWPQILLDNTDQIKKGYGINGYPTTFLLNKEGVIIATNLRGKELEEKILNLIKE